MPIIFDKTMCNELKEKISRKFKTTYINSFALSTLPPPLNTHPDIQIHFLSPKIAICAPECYEYYLRAFGKNKGKLLKGSSVPGGTYPSDTAYNIARVGRHVFCNTRFAESMIIDYYLKNGFDIHHINQGYAKCCMCIADDKTVITEDSGIYNTLVKIPDINVLLIKPGNVTLSGYSHGFIGGASGLINSTIVFTGRLPEEVREFLKSRRIEFFEASDSGLIDFGSIIYRR